MGAATDVASTIFAAATDGTDQLRYVVGPDAIGTLEARESLDDAAFLGMVRGNFGLVPSQS